jgi:hypothetical protein
MIMKEQKADKMVSGCSKVIAILFPICLILVVIQLVIIPWIRERRKETEAREIFGDMMDMCLTPPQEKPAEVPMVEEAPKLLVLELNHNELHEWHDQLPSSRRAETPEEVDIVICANRKWEGNEVLIEVCHYKFTDDTVTMYRYDPNIIALDPATGQVIARGVLEGKQSGMCPTLTTEEAHDDTDRGHLPDFSIFLDWIDENLR